MDPQGQHDAAGSAEDLAGAGTFGPRRHPRLLVTAGPTHEPIDEVRFLGNRSTGRLGMAIAADARRRGWPVTLLLGPVATTVPLPPQIEVVRFSTARDLERLLSVHGPTCDLLIMAAAVADHRPAVVHPGKRRRGDGTLMLELEAVPDLIGTFSRRRLRIDGLPAPVVVAFALEPANELEASAREKLRRKGVEAIVANPIETLGAEGIEATMILADGTIRRPCESGGRSSKAAFAGWLLDEAYRLVPPPREHGGDATPHTPTPSGGCP